MLNRIKNGAKFLLILVASIVALLSLVVIIPYSFFKKSSRPYTKLMTLYFIVCAKIAGEQ